MKLKPLFHRWTDWTANGRARHKVRPATDAGTATEALWSDVKLWLGSCFKCLGETEISLKIRRTIEPYLNRAHAWFDSSFRAKVLLPVAGCMAVVMAITFFVVDHRIERQAEQEARSTLATANAALRSSQDSRRNNLLLRFHNLPNAPFWRQFFQFGQSKNLHNTLRDLMDMQKVDIVLYASNGGKILDVEENNPAIPVAEFEAASAPVLKLALSGNEKADTVCVGGKLYDVVAVPAYDMDHKQIGVLTLGSEIGDAVAQEFSKLTQSQVALVANGQIITSTLPGLNANEQFTNMFQDALPAADSANPTSNVKPVQLNGLEYYCVAGRFESLTKDSNHGYVLLSSREQSLAAKRVTRHVLAGMGFLAIGLGTVAVCFLVNKVTEPLRELRQGAEAVGSGDFNRRVPVRSRDECGQLATVFNRMTENLQQSRLQLEKTVETLKTTQEQLVQSEKLSAIGEFVAGVAHELNNPLAAVVGFSEMLKEQPADEKSQQYAESILNAALRCKKIVQSLLCFARREQPERKLISVNTLVATVLEIVNYSLHTGNIEVVTQLEPDLPMVLADTNQILQVLLNIINNAHQAIETKQQAGRIKIITENRTPNVRITIQDTGPGISREHLRRIFDPFFTTKEVGKGTGLGLSLCYGLIKKHGGTITPLSQPGEGATFIIELPIAAQADAAAVSTARPEREKPHTHEGDGKRVLVIDDEKPILNMLRDELAVRGYEVDVADNGETALRKLEKNHFDLAFCDWKMPGLNGRQIYEQLRQTNPGFCQRIIFITGDVINTQMRHFLETEKRPCLTKPFTLSELHTTVKTTLKTA